MRNYQDGMPKRVWEPSRNEKGEIIFPLRWSSREAHPGDVIRRATGQTQAWQEEIREEREAIKVLA